MTIQNLLEEAYEDTNTSTANYPYTKGLKKLNEIYSEMYRMIVTTQEDYFWTYWNTDLQQWSREYKVEREQTSYVNGEWVTVYVPWIEKVKKVVIRTDEDTSYELPELSDLEESNGMKGWKLKDNHIFLNWTPDKTIEWGLEIQGIEAINPISDLTATIEDTIFPWHSDFITSASVVLALLQAVAFTLLLLEKMSKFLLLRHQGWLEYLSVCCPAGSQAL